MNAHFIAWMSITLTFVVLGGGAYVVDTIYADTASIVGWGHRPAHLQLAHAVFFYGGLYAVCNFLYHLFGLRRVRRDIRRARDADDLCSLAISSRPRAGTGADGLVRLDLGGDDAARAFARALAPRLWEIRSAALALTTVGCVALLAGLLAMVGELHSAARGIALTGAGYTWFTVGWAAASSLHELAVGLFVALTCAFGTYILYSGARDAARELALVPVARSHRARLTGP